MKPITARGGSLNPLKEAGRRAPSASATIVALPLMPALADYVGANGTECRLTPAGDQTATQASPPQDPLGAQAGGEQPFERYTRRPSGSPSSGM